MGARTLFTSLEVSTSYYGNGDNFGVRLITLYIAQYLELFYVVVVVTINIM